MRCFRRYPGGWTVCLEGALGIEDSGTRTRDGNSRITISGTRIHGFQIDFTSEWNEGFGEGLQIVKPLGLDRL